MMSDVELRKLAHYIVLEASGNEELLTKVAKMLQKSGKNLQRRNVNAKVAADMLGISVRQLRRIKDSFSYVKTGNTQQSGIMFNANTLHEEYEAYIASKVNGNKLAQIKPINMAI